VGRLAEVLHDDLPHPQRQLHHLRPVARMHQHRGVGAGKDPGLDQRDFPAPLLLGRAADQQHLARARRKDRLHGQGGAQGRRPDDVVPAGVAQPGQRVVLGQERDPGLARPGVPREGRGQPGHAAGHHEVVPLQDGGEPLGRLELLVRQLRVRVQEPARVEEFRGKPVHLRLHAFLQGVQDTFSGHDGLLDPVMAACRDNQNSRKIRGNPGHNTMRPQPAQAPRSPRGFPLTSIHLFGICTP